MAEIVPFHQAGSIPPELEAEALALQRRQAIAKALTAKAMESMKTNQMVGDRVVPMGMGEGIAHIGQALLAAKANKDVEAQTGDMGRRYQAGLIDALSKFQSRSEGTPGQRDPQELEQAQDGQSPLPYKVNPDPKGAAVAAMMSGYAPVAKLGETEYGLEKARQLEREKHYVLAPGAVGVRGGKVEIANANKPQDDKSIPDSWESDIPPNATKGTTKGTYRDKDGDLIQLKYQGGKLIDTHNVNPMPVTRDSTKPGDRAATLTTITDPMNPNKTITVNANTFNEAKYKTGDRTGVVGEGVKEVPQHTRDAKLIQQMPQARLRTETMVQNLQRLHDGIQALHDDKGLNNITGTVAGRTWNLTNTATSAQNQLDFLKSNIFQSALQSMREASKTGGAVGNVSDKEGDKLERTLAGLNQSAGTPAFKKQLKDAQTQVKLSMELLHTAFEEQFGGVMSAQTDVRSEADKILGLTK